MKRKNYVIGNKLLSSLLLILIGIMFIILKGEGRKLELNMPIIEESITYLIRCLLVNLLFDI